MKQFGGFEDAQKAARYAGSAKIPSGAYVAKIMNVRYVPGENGNSDRIDIQFDIAEGDYKGLLRALKNKNIVIMDSSIGNVYSLEITNANIIEE